ncbi:hypothetical protein ACROYT_G033312 [Oculina patagonica]
MATSAVFGTRVNPLCVICAVCRHTSRLLVPIGTSFGAFAEEQIVEDDGGVPPPSPDAENSSVSVPANPVEGGSGSPTVPASVEASSGGQQDGFADDAYAFTCDQAMPDSQESLVNGSPVDPGDVPPLSDGS